MSITLGGYNDVVKNMQAWAQAVKKNAQNALFDSLDELLLNAQHDCPYKTGHLHDSLTREIDADGMHGQVYTPVIYGLFVEMGTRRMAAQPFLYPNWKREIPLFQERIRAAVLI